MRLFFFFDPKHRLTRPPAAILVLLVLLVSVEALLSLADRGVILPRILRFVCYRLGAFDPNLLRGGTPLYQLQPWAMFLTHVFVHIGLLHMLANVITLYLLWYLMPWMYVLDFLLVFAGAAVGGALAFLWLAPAGAIMTGASGGVAGLAAVWVVYEMFLVHRGYVLSFRPKRTMVLAGLVVLTVLMSIDQRIGTAWQVHLGGVAVGLAFAVGLVLRAILDDRYGPFDRPDDS
jgi:membrane associated rhomboid family serine protease